MGAFAGPTLSWWNLSGGTDTLRSNIATTKIVQSGLVLNLDAGVSSSYPGSETTWTDLSGNGNNGTLVNGVGFDSANGGSLSFDGTNDFVDTTATTNTFSADFSVCGWYNASTNTGNFRILFETDGYRQETGGIAIYQWNDTFRIFKLNSSGSYTQMIITSSGTIGLNVWKQFVLVRNNGVLRFYLNTNLSGTYSTDSENYYLTNLTGKYNIGRGRTLYPFNGNIAQVSIYNRALTASEISQNYNALRGRFGL